MMDAFFHLIIISIIFNFIFQFLTDDKSDSKSSAALAELENIDDECDQKVW
jgi:hypothetical protein